MELKNINIEDLLETAVSHLKKIQNCNLSYKIEKIMENEYSKVIIFLAYNKKKVERYFLKQANISNSKTMIINEYNTLINLFPKFKDTPKLRVPEPVLIIPEYSCIIVKGYKYPSLHADTKYLKYLVSKKKFNILKNKFRLLGNWIKHLHNFSFEQISCLEFFEQINEFCDYRLLKLEKSKIKSIPVGFRKHVIGLMENAKMELIGIKIPLVGTHGDFGSWNVLSTDEGIMVIDFATYKKGPICNDLLRMFVYFNDQTLNPFQSKKRIKNLFRSFLSGYGPLPEVPNSLIYICEIKNRLTSLFGAIFPSAHWRNKLEQKLIIRNHFNWFYQNKPLKTLWDIYT